VTRETRNELRLADRPGAIAASDLEDFAAELTEAAFPVAPHHGVGVNWLDRKLELWKAMTRTVHAWQQHAR
jgi:hypothetical protein